MDITALLVAMGVSPSIVLLITSLIAAASAIDAAVPQPAQDSPWFIPRKILSFVAINFCHAKNAGSSGNGGGNGGTGLVILFCVSLTAGLSACASKPPATQVYLLRAGYDTAVLAPASAYAGLPRCSDTVVTACSQPDIVAAIIKADATAQAALDAAETVVRHHPTMDSAAAVEAATQAIVAVRTILITYRIIKE